MNQSTKDLIGVLKNIKHVKPKFLFVSYNQNGYYLKFKSSTSKVQYGSLDNFLYYIYEEEFNKLDWIEINTALGYKVHNDYDIIF